MCSHTGQPKNGVNISCDWLVTHSDNLEPVIYVTLTNIFYKSTAQYTLVLIGKAKLSHTSRHYSESSAINNVNRDFPNNQAKQNGMNLTQPNSTL